MKPFRFGFQITSLDPVQVSRSARKAERAGFDVLHIGDHVGAETSVFAALTAAALCTRALRLGPLVLNNDFRHPVIAAQELATIDQLSNGRLEVGIGAGHSFTEYAAIGERFDPPRRRKARLAESVEILRPLFDGQRVTYRGEHYQLDEAVILQPVQDHVPILVGVNGRVALAHAARHADIVSPTMLGRTLSDGQRHEVRWEASRLDETVAWIKSQAGRRWALLELHALVQAVVITEDRRTAAEEIASRTDMDVRDILVTPFLCLGTHQEICNHLLYCRERWGFSFYTVREITAFSPVIEHLRKPIPQKPRTPP